MPNLVSLNFENFFKWTSKILEFFCDSDYVNKKIIFKAFSRLKFIFLEISFMRRNQNLVQLPIQNQLQWLR